MAPNGSAGVVIRSTTALVQVRVAAEDARGKPVTDLRQQDFEVQDDRKPQPIAAFSADRGAAAASGLNGPVEKQTPAVTDREPGYALLVLDWLNTKYADRVSVQDEVVKLVQSFQPGQKVGLFVLSHEPGLPTPYTSDMSLLAQIAAKADLDPSDMGVDSPGFFSARYGGRPAVQSREMQISDWNKKVQDSFRALEAMAERLARLPGRKSLIWLSAGFPIQIDGKVVPGLAGIEKSYRQRFEKLIDMLNRADVAVYSIDARGLTAGGGGLPLQSRGYLETMMEAAERTGGTAFYDRNDLGEGVRLALEDHRLGYTLAFRVPDHASLGDHDIRVSVKRPGVRLRYRESYQLVNSIK